MNTYVAIVVVGVVAVIAAATFMLWPRDTAQLPPPQGTQTPNSPNVINTPITQPNQGGGGTQPSPEEQAVQQTYEVVVNQNGNQDNIRLGTTAVKEGWALQSWVGDMTGGEALLKYSTTTKTWEVVEIGGGAWSVEGLMMFGVPQEIAAFLVVDIRN